MPADFNPADRAFMAQALRLAAQGLYTTTPNPRVGALVVNGLAALRGERAGALSSSPQN